MKKEGEKVTQPDKYRKNYFIIWIDQNIRLPLENLDHDKKLRELFNNKYQGFENVDDALTFMSQKEDFELIVICSGQIAYSFLKVTQNYDIIIYCGDKKKHSQLFLGNQRVLVMIDSNFGDVIAEIQERLQYNESLQKLDQIFNPKVLQCEQYQHSEKYISISFFFLMEQYDRNGKISLEKVISDIVKLFPARGPFYPKTLHSKIENLRNHLDREISVFESLLYLYSSSDIYDEMNKCFASCRFEEVSCLFLCLLQGFLAVKCQVKGKLYRGINLQEQNYQNLLNSLKESQKKRTSLFWNALSSTSLDKQVAIKFSFSYCKYGSIVFVILLDKNDPHPHQLIDESLAYYKYEKEVLLFPLFEFQVVKIKEKKCKQFCIQYTKVTIKQKKDSFSQVFHNHKKHSYWMNDIRNEIKPYFDSINKFHFKRYNYFINQKDQFLEPHQYNQVMQQQFVYSQQLNKNIIKQVLPFMNLDIIEQFEFQFTENQSIELKDIFSEYIKNFYDQIQNKFYLKGSEIKIENLNKTLNHLYKVFEKNIDIYKLESCSGSLENVKWLLWYIVSIIIPQLKISSYIFLFIFPKLFKAVKVILQIFKYKGITKMEKIEKIVKLIVYLIIQILQDVARYFCAFYPDLSIPLGKILNYIDQNINFKVEMNSKNYSKVNNGILADPGFNPRCVWSNVNEKVKSFIIYASDKDQIFWLVPNIPGDRREIHENCGLGIKLENNSDYIYIGPKSEWDASFNILGIAEESIDQELVIEKLKNNQIQIVQQSFISQVF